MNTELMNPVVATVGHVFPVAIFDIAAPIASRFKLDDEIEDEGAEIDDDDDEDDVGNPFDEENLPLEDEFDDEDFPSEDEDQKVMSFTTLLKKAMKKLTTFLMVKCRPLVNNTNWMMTRRMKDRYYSKYRPLMLIRGQRLECVALSTLTPSPSPSGRGEKDSNSVFRTRTNPNP